MARFIGSPCEKRLVWLADDRMNAVTTNFSDSLSILSTCAKGRPRDNSNVGPRPGPCRQVPMWPPRGSEEASSRGARRLPRGRVCDLREGSERAPRAKKAPGKAASQGGGGHDSFPGAIGRDARRRWPDAVASALGCSRRTPPARSGQWEQPDHVLLRPDRRGRRRRSAPPASVPVAVRFVVRRNPARGIPRCGPIHADRLLILLTRPLPGRDVRQAAGNALSRSRRQTPARQRPVPSLV